MSKEIKTAFLIRLSGKDRLPMMFKNDFTGRKEAADYAWHLLEILPYDAAEVWHLDTLSPVALINRSENTDLK